MSTSSPKTQMGGSQTWGSSYSDSRGQSVRRRRTKLTSDKKIADDEFMAAAIGDVEWLKQSLKDAGQDINFDKNGLTAIHLAAIHGRLDCLKVCIEKFKIDINLPSSTGWRPIHLCISNQTGKRSLLCLAYLLEKGADCSVANDDGITPVHQAASEGHVQCLKMLLEVGARIDGKDCRGNTPLDLAKLWGHRKCARILAAEMWHQDKDSVAKEMQQLKKVKMQQVLKELEEEEEFKAARQFYGDEAFKQWMAAKDLTAKPAGATSSQKERETKKESLYMPNSVSRRNEDQKPSGTTNTKVSMDARKMTDKPTKKDTNSDEVSDEALLKGLLDGEDLDKAKDDKPAQAKANMIAQHEADWNKSTKVSPNPYVSNLGDDFPRDEYTMMALVKGAPKYYEGKFVHPLTPDVIDEDVKKKGSGAKLRKPRLPSEVISSVLNNDPNAIKRGMIFKCKHIEDVHTKKKYDSDIKGRPEAPLHLTDDVSSYLVKNSVRLRKGGPKTSSTKSDSSSRLTCSEWTDDNFPLPLVMQTLKNMTKPSHFPNVHGSEYLINFGDVK